MSPRKTLVGAAAIAACAVLSAAPLRAVDISVQPNQGGIGQNVTLQSFDFAPVKKPRVRLVPHPEQTATKPVWAKVTEFTDSAIELDLTKGAAGVYDVVVVPKDRGVEEVTLSQPFTILAPAPETALPGNGPAGTEVTIHGAYFGPSKGKVTIGGKKAKVKSWADDAIVVVISKKAPAGEQPVVVTNKAGASTVPLSFDVADSGQGGGGGGGGGGGSSDLYFRADLSDRGKFDLTNPDSAEFGAAWDQVSGQLMLRGTTDTFDGLPSLELTINGFVPEGPFPFVVGLEPSPPDLRVAFMQYSEGDEIPTFYLAGFGMPGAALTVTIASWDGTILTGTFSGTLVDPQGALPPIVVTNGMFRVRILTDG